MAKLHDKGSGRRLCSSDPQQLASTVQSFLSTCRKPAALDFGDQPLLLLPGNHALEVRSNRLVLEAWDETRSLCRRILAIESAKPGVLDCAVQRFGGVAGRLTLLDLERPQAAPRALKASRNSFAEIFRRMLSRQFPSWHIQAFTSAPDLHRSFSALYPRAHLCRGNRHLAALACPARDLEPEFMSGAILWFDYLASRLPAGHSLSLQLLLPEDAGNMTAHRLSWLTGRELLPSLFRFNAHGLAGEVDGRDLGNLDTKLQSHWRKPELTAELSQLLARLQTRHGVGCHPESDGAVSIRYRGMKFARIVDGDIWLGIDPAQESRASEAADVERFASQLAELSASNKSRSIGVLPTFPERWLESSVRNNLQVLDADLQPEPVHGQVLTFAGGERNLIDLLAISYSARLTLIELKAGEDVQLPIQGLDYWMRIRWHAGRGELGPLFPNLAITKTSPKLLLVSPALTFHPTNEIVLRYFSPEIEVERLGVNSDWDTTLQVAFRLRGADLPISHRGSK